MKCWYLSVMLHVLCATCSAVRCVLHAAQYAVQSACDRLRVCLRAVQVPALHLRLHAHQPPCGHTLLLPTAAASQPASRESYHTPPTLPSLRPVQPLARPPRTHPPPVSLSLPQLWIRIAQTVFLAVHLLAALLTMIAKWARADSILWAWCKPCCCAPSHWLFDSCVPGRSRHRTDVAIIAADTVAHKQAEEEAQEYHTQQRRRLQQQKEQQQAAALQEGAAAQREVLQREAQLAEQQYLRRQRHQQVAEAEWRMRQHLQQQGQRQASMRAPLQHAPPGYRRQEAPPPTPEEQRQWQQQWQYVPAASMVQDSSAGLSLLGSASGSLSAGVRAAGTSAAAAGRAEEAQQQQRHSDQPLLRPRSGRTSMFRHWQQQLVGQSGQQQQEGPQSGAAQQGEATAAAPGQQQQQAQQQQAQQAQQQQRHSSQLARRYRTEERWSNQRVTPNSNEKHSGSRVTIELGPQL
jgi:hypothetical protein